MDEVIDSNNVGLNFPEGLSWIPWRIVFSTRAGSHAYGTVVPESDVDVRTVVIPPLSHYFSFRHSFDHWETRDGSLDFAADSLQKFLGLAIQGNPNAIELLFTDPSDQTIFGFIGEELLGARELFLTKRLYPSMMGYAAQLISKLAPSRDDSDRGRRQLIEQYGYDTKAAMHAVRMLRMCREVFAGDGMKVRRPDAEELLRLRRGSLTLQQMRDYLMDLDQRAADAYQHTKLPEAPDEELIDDLCMNLVVAGLSTEIQMPIMATGFKAIPMTFSAFTLMDKDLTSEPDTEDEPQPEEKKS